MEDFTLLLSGMDFAEGPGFVLLAADAAPGAELTLDPTCALARPRAQTVPVAQFYLMRGELRHAGAFFF